MAEEEAEVEAEEQEDVEEAETTAPTSPLQRQSRRLLISTFTT